MANGTARLREPKRHLEREGEVAHETYLYDNNTWSTNHRRKRLKLILTRPGLRSWYPCGEVKEPTVMFFQIYQKRNYFGYQTPAPARYIYVGFATRDAILTTQDKFYFKLPRGPGKAVWSLKIDRHWQEIDDWLWGQPG